jgi:hypothetical protein
MRRGKMVAAVGETHRKGQGAPNRKPWGPSPFCGLPVLSLVTAESMALLEFEVGEGMVGWTTKFAVPEYTPWISKCTV